MSETFTLKIKIANAEKPARDIITRLAAALEEDDHALVRQIATEAFNAAPKNRKADDLVAALLLPCSEYGPMEVPFMDALCGVLEETTSYLHVSGSKKLNIELNGTDNGTADAASYLLALLHSLPVDELSASGKGFTWMAKWAGDAQGVLQVASYEPLDEGQRIDPKAEEKWRRKVQKSNKEFVTTPNGFLVGEVDKNCTGSLSSFIKTIKEKTVLAGQKYADIMRIAGKFGEPGHYSSDVFSIDCATHGPQSVVMSIVWDKLDISPEQMHDYFSSSDIAFISQPIEHKDSDTGDLAKYGDDYEWAVRDIAICASIKEEEFKLKIARRAWIYEKPLIERFQALTSASVLEAVYWRDLSDALEAEAKKGDQVCIEQFSSLCKHPRPGCKTHVAYMRELLEGS